MKNKRNSFSVIAMAMAMATFLFMASTSLYAEPVASPQASLQSDKVVKGQVLDNFGDPILGANIKVKNTTNGCITGVDGSFSINAPANAILVVSYIGYTTKEVAVKDAAHIVLEENATSLDDVVVVGYGTQKKASLTGAVAVVNEKAFQEKGGLASPLEALQGQVAGVMITRSSTAPGDESWSMNLRGSSSVNSTEPLIIIDGVAANSVSEMRNLNPNDIENISFLKDGSAAIYGSRAAGGVVIITTKKGTEGRVKIDYSGSATLKTVGLMPHLMNIDQWANTVM